MSLSLGLDIGGTKIAGAIYAPAGVELSKESVATPKSYDNFLKSCQGIVVELEKKSGPATTLGVGICGHLDREVGIIEAAANLPFLNGKPVRADLERLLNRRINIENDANCAALAEAACGAGKGCASVFGLILGTGVGGGYVLDGRIVTGANGFCGGIGHLSFPWRDPTDGEEAVCGCGRKGCIESYISGSGLARLYKKETGQDADARQIGILAQTGDADATRVLDKYYTLVAKAMTVILHTFDPEIITVSGGLSVLPGLCEEVPKCWKKYALCATPKTRFVQATFGATAGMRGAALL